MAVAGHLCLDVIPGLDDGVELRPGALESVGPLALRLGGSVANTGGALVALGSTVSASAVVGDDELGSIARTRLRASGIDDRAVVTLPGSATSYSIVIDRPSIDRTFWHHTGANESFDAAHVAFDGADALHIGYPSLLPALTGSTGEPLRGLLAEARRAGVVTSVDLAVVDGADERAWADVLSMICSETDVLSPSIDDLTSALDIDESSTPELAAELAELLLSWGAAIAAVSAGPHGVIVRVAGHERLAAAGSALADVAQSWAEARLTIPSALVGTPVTTTGAGDALSAGLLHGILTGLPPLAAGRLACATAARVLRGAA